MTLSTHSGKAVNAVGTRVTLPVWQGRPTFNECFSGPVQYVLQPPRIRGREYVYEWKPINTPVGCLDQTQREAPSRMVCNQWDSRVCEDCWLERPVEQFSQYVPSSFHDGFRKCAL